MIDVAKLAPNAPRSAKDFANSIIRSMQTEMEQPYDPRHGLFSPKTRSTKNHAVDIMAKSAQWTSAAAAEDPGLFRRASYLDFRPKQANFDHNWATFARQVNEHLKAANAGVEVIGVAIHPATQGWAVVFHSPEISGS